MEFVVNSFSSCALYTPGAFFFYPWKPVLLLFFGDGYDTAYRHFRRDHSDPLNLMLHFVCLFFQLVGNFALLGRVDALFSFQVPVWNGVQQIRWFTAATVFLWILTLVSAHSKGSPPISTILSTISMCAAYIATPHIPARTLEIGAMAAFLLVMVLCSLFVDRVSGRKTYRRSLKGVGMDVGGTIGTFALVISARLGVTWLGYRGHFSAEADTIFYAVIGLMAAISASPKPLLPGVLCGIFVVRSAAELIESETLIYYSVAMVAMSMQGRAHDVTKQRATLVSLEGNKKYGRAKKLAFEWSHVCFFPALLWRSALQSYQESHENVSAPSKTK
jgi:hypothetical protein|eukprot:g3915.t1